MTDRERKSLIGGNERYDIIYLILLWVKLEISTLDYYLVERESVRGDKLCRKLRECRPWQVWWMCDEGRSAFTYTTLEEVHSRTPPRRKCIHVHHCVWGCIHVHHCEWGCIHVHHGEKGVHSRTPLWKGVHSRTPLERKCLHLVYCEGSASMAHSEGIAFL